MNVQTILQEVEKLAPPHFAFGFDKIGLQVGDPANLVNRVAVSLDSGLGAIRFALQHNAQVLVCHHPVIWDPVKSIVSGKWTDQRIIEAIQGNLSIIAAHTNWDCAKGGINDVLAETIGLTDICTFGNAEPESQWKLVTFVPHEAKELLLDVLTQAGAGKIGEYSGCAFFTEGTGSFVGSNQTNPYIGRPGERAYVEECRLEVLVPQNLKSKIEKELVSNHPYETPAFDWVSLAQGSAHPAGRIGTYTGKEPLQQWVDRVLDCRSEMWVGHTRRIERVSVVGGAAAGEWQLAKESGADAFITGEVPQHIGLEASESGLTILAAGHYATEQPGMRTLAQILQTQLSCDVHLFEPQPGQSGRPI